MYLDLFVLVVLCTDDRSVLSVLLRASEDLLGISSGILIEGCMDAADRTETTEDLEVGTEEGMLVILLLKTLNT